MSGLIDMAKSIVSAIPLEKLAAEGIERRWGSHKLLCSRPNNAETSGYLPSLSEIADSHPSGFFGVGYAHVIPCATLCPFCPYPAVSASQIYNYNKQGRDFLKDYLGALQNEIMMHKNAFGKLKADALYFGGGTPSFLSPKQLEVLFDVVGVFDVTPSAEITFEIAPVTLHDKGQAMEKLRVLKDYGVNRVSMGVQSFDDRVLRFAHRMNSNEPIVRKAVSDMRDAGFMNLNVDLIFGLPSLGSDDEKLVIFEKDLQKTASLEPESITTYHLRIEENTPFMGLYQLHPEYFPSVNPTTITMKVMATEFLRECGYKQMPTDWFYKNMGVHVAQVRKWRDGEDLLGIGAGAYSSLQSSGWKFRNIGDINNRMGSTLKYIDKASLGESPLAEGRKFSYEEQMEGYVKLALKTGVNLGFFEERFKANFFDMFPQARRLQKLGVVEVNGDALSLSYIGNLLAEEVAGRFLFRGES